jgi:hypothetical protein
MSPFIILDNLDNLVTPDNLNTKDEALSVARGAAGLSYDYECYRVMRHEAHDAKYHLVCVVVADNNAVHVLEISRTFKVR